ncbi:hypothetical protein LCGC14_3075610 [marine sediment metagenome]|uniref:Uncharacterized protein n=1 Tax=marine sediment metagenome TaxID=412755 RepID=A0A0F8WEN9_9ZZZZ
MPSGRADFPLGPRGKTPFGSHQADQYRLTQLLLLMVADRGANRKSTLAENEGFEPPQV